MPPFPSVKSVPIVAAAVLSLALVSFASGASAQAPGGPGARMGGPRMGAEHMNDAQTGEHHQSRRFERMLRLYDTDGDGKISLAEINADQARMFTALDVNGDKSMSVEEIRRRGRALQIFRTTTLFDLLDVDGDGKLSLAEIQGPSKRWFKRYDKNGDGILDEEELAAGGPRFGRGGWRR